MKFTTVVMVYGILVMLKDPLSWVE